MKKTATGDLIGIRSVAAYLCTSPDKVIELMRDPVDGLPHRKLSKRKTFFRPSEIDEWMLRRAKQAVKENHARSFKGRLARRFRT